VPFQVLTQHPYLVVFGKKDFATFSRLIAAHYSKQSGLSGPVSAKERKPFTGMNRDRSIFEYGPPSK
jgi:hypothetical protein